MRFQGRIADWNDDRGFGFITPNGGGERVFLHIKALRRSLPRPAVNEMASYVLSRDPKGRLRASDVALVGGRAAPVRDRRFGLFATVAALLVLAAGLVAWRTPMVGLVHVIASAVTFIAYATDKAAATANRRRIPETTLHTLALLGGWPGALAAQQMLRHKTSKPSFLAVFWLTVIANVLVLVLVGGPLGEGFLGGVLNRPG